MPFPLTILFHITLTQVEGFPIAVRGAPYDDTSRWRVFKSTDDVSINRLPAGPAAADKDKNKDKDKKVSKRVEWYSSMIFHSLNILIFSPFGHTGGENIFAWVIGGGNEIYIWDGWGRLSENSCENQLKSKRVIF